MKTGIKFALKKDIDILVKIDSDGQMSPHLIPKLVKPIIEGKAEVNKGNRFRNPSVLAEMPLVRLLGNIGLGFLTKISTGYWELFDPTNGFIAIKKNILLSKEAYILMPPNEQTTSTSSEIMHKHRVKEITT